MRADPRGWVAVIFAATLGAAVLLIVFDITVGDGHLDPGGREWVAALLGGMFGSLSTYVGSSRRTASRRPPRKQTGTLPIERRWPMSEPKTPEPTEPDDPQRDPGT